MTHLVTPAAQLRVLRCNRVPSVCAWHGALPTVHVCFEKSFTLITCNLNPGPHLGDRNSRSKFKTKTGTCVDSRQLQVETVSGRNKKNENPQERSTSGQPPAIFTPRSVADRGCHRLSFVISGFLDHSDVFHSVEDDH